jgi:hypothetical protein
MAYSSKYGFIYKRHLSPAVGTPAVLYVTLANSAGPIVVGNAVKWSSGYLVGAPISSAVLGILVGFVNKYGDDIFKNFLGPAVKGTKSGDDTYTAASDNQTVDMVQGAVKVDTDALFFGYSDSNLTQASVGLFFNGKVNSNTYVDGVTGTGGAYSAGTQQFQLVELVTTLGDGTAVANAGLFKIIRSQLQINDVT